MLVAKSKERIMSCVIRHLGAKKMTEFSEIIIANTGLTLTRLRTGRITSAIRGAT